jgi:hypothetical protein
MSDPEIELQTPIADKARGFAPVVWLLGKVQSGEDIDHPRVDASR